jgi:hypothetical protein
MRDHNPPNANPNAANGKSARRAPLAWLGRLIPSMPSMIARSLRPGWMADYRREGPRYSELLPTLKTDEVAAMGGTTQEIQAWRASREETPKR